MTSSPPHHLAEQPGVASPKSLEHGRNFLASLFMAVRTAQIHDPSNQAFEQAVQSLLKVAQALFQATGGFSLRFVEDSVFLNGTRLRFEGGTYSSTQTLREMLAGKGLGGLELHNPPSAAALRKLVMLFAPHAPTNSKAGLQALLGEIRVLGIQRFQDPRSDVRVDRRVMVVQSYGKLILGLRERLQRFERRRAAGFLEPMGPPRLKPVRVVQDMVELCQNRADFLVRLSTNRQGAPIRELYGVNACLLSLVMGHTIGLPRSDLVDIGLAALFVPLGFEPGLGHGDVHDASAANAAVARLLTDSGMSLSTYTRCIVLGEQCGLGRPDIGAPAHPYAEMVRCACAYQQLVLGLSSNALHPLAALARLVNDRASGIDLRWIDLLINVLRAFPKGTHVVLDDGSVAEVIGQTGGARWDRPLVRVFGDGRGPLDLMAQRSGRFVHRIRSTAFYAGQADSPGPRLAEASPDVEIAVQPTAIERWESTSATTRSASSAMAPPLPTDLEDPVLEEADTNVTLFEPPFGEPPSLLPADALKELPDEPADSYLGVNNDPFDLTQSDSVDGGKTQESPVPLPWEE